MATSIKTGVLVHKRDWAGDLVGLIQVSGLWIISSFLLFQQGGMGTKWPLYFLVACSMPAYAVYCLRHENDLTVIKSGLGATENQRLVELAIQKLGWQIISNTRYCITAGANNKWWRGAGQTLTVLLDQDNIYLNVVHGGTVKARLPFYFGSNQRKLKRLIATINMMQLLHNPMPTT
ncbi:hypothetical protein [Hymenobacter oligotrophus]|uniref:hypothetical protein n=1 Tax=Hymenobacter oligotrophus TaxID=2319843 RepID=UPI0013C2F222|nr:hypothetical protein [Hymenobacter oligotrophus]